MVEEPNTDTLRLRYEQENIDNYIVAKNRLKFEQILFLIIKEFCGLYYCFQIQNIESNSPN